MLGTSSARESYAGYHCRLLIAIERDTYERQLHAPHAVRLLEVHIVWMKYVRVALLEVCEWSMLRRLPLYHLAKHSPCQEFRMIP